ncbi:hypothetical protein SDC9_161716 [bioreactor metagenome]|uniref:N-acetyltransferase domain-containing protein n=1 Tax=bioreactor metagenome TaxID=1076179 RepID=A0A645FM16_9ZZZZ
MDNVLLRNERESDYRAVEALTRDAFWNEHFPGCNEHYLIHIMRTSDAFVKELDFVAELEGKIVGHIAYARAKIARDGGDEIDVLTFGPLSVLPALQGKGIGGKLVNHTLALAKQLGYTSVLIYGDPDYYHRFGFVAAKTYGIGTADNMYMPALQALELVSGALSDARGRFFEGEIYNVNEAAVKAFERGFEPKKLLSGLPSQIKFLKMLEQRVPRS